MGIVDIRFGNGNIKDAVKSISIKNINSRNSFPTIEEIEEEIRRYFDIDEAPRLAEIVLDLVKYMSNPKAKRERTELLKNMNALNWHDAFQMVLPKELWSDFNTEHAHCPELWHFYQLFKVNPIYEEN